MAFELNLFDVFLEDVFEKKHNFQSDTFKLLFTNEQPLASDTSLLDFAEIAPGNGYPAGGLALDLVGSGQSSGAYRYIVDVESFQANGGPVGPLRFFVLYNATAGKLVGWYDYNSSLTLQDGEIFVFNFDPVNGLLFVEKDS
jgi:hypothetical protein